MKRMFGRLRVSQVTARQALLVLLVVALALELLACDGSDDAHPPRPDPDVWTTIAVSEDKSALLLVLNETGMEYVALLRDPEDTHSYAYGLCERWDSTGTLRRDGAATKGGTFGFDVMESVEDASGLTRVLRDRQTGIAYRYHKWSGDSDYGGGEGLSPCYDKEGRLQRYDDDRLLPVTVEEPLVDAYSVPTDGSGLD